MVLIVAPISAVSDDGLPASAAVKTSPDVTGAKAMIMLFVIGHVEFVTVRRVDDDTVEYRQSGGGQVGGPFARFIGRKASAAARWGNESASDQSPDFP